MPPVSFYQSKLVGRWAEERALALMASPLDAAVDVTADPFYQSLDVDIVLSPIDGHARPTFVEVKADTHKPRNIFLETLSNVQTGSPGWAVYTASHTIMYFFVKEGLVLCLDTGKLRDWMKRVGIDKQAKWQKTFKNLEGHDVQGYAVPVKVLLADPLLGATVSTGHEVMN